MWLSALLAGCLAPPPLPPGPLPFGLPASQVIENGIQVHPAPGTGAPPVLAPMALALQLAVGDALAQTECIPRQRLSGNMGFFCDRQCPGTATTGCPVTVSAAPPTVTTRLASATPAAFEVPFGYNTTTSVHITYTPVVGPSQECTMTVVETGTVLTPRLEPGLQATGAFSGLRWASWGAVPGSTSVTGCGSLGPIVTQVTDALFTNGTATNLLRPRLDSSLQSRLAATPGATIRSPPGIAGRIDLTAALTGLAPLPALTTFDPLLLTSIDPRVRARMTS